MEGDWPSLKGSFLLPPGEYPGVEGSGGEGSLETGLHVESGVGRYGEGGSVKSDSGSCSVSPATQPSRGSSAAHFIGWN